MQYKIFGFLKPSIDAHTLGISTISKYLRDCGYKTIIANPLISKVITELENPANVQLLKKWIIDNQINQIGFSYRLDPQDAQKYFRQLIFTLRNIGLLSKNRETQISNVYFAGLPDACTGILKEYNGAFNTFCGDESVVESLMKMDVPESKIPSELHEGSIYDEIRTTFAKKLISEGKYLERKPFDRSLYPDFGSRNDSVIKRLNMAASVKQLPLIRVHVGPYDSDRQKALCQFKSWLKELGQSGYLDIVSIGSSQLSQSNFGEDWGNMPNGGGVPINSVQDFEEIWEVSRPMLLRTYAGTKDIQNLARVYEKTINIAWHALSFWWFCEIDGRGPYSVKHNLTEHIETLKYIAQTGKPFEPNVPHHFAFRGADDYTYVLSAYLSAKTAKRNGIRHLILQNMLNTPKYCWSIQDLAKSRAMLKLIKSLEDDSFTVYLQPRAGLDFFSNNISKAKEQLVSVTAMMDDIEPYNCNSPQIIHVVSFSEAVNLATPSIINESIKITLQSLEDYRAFKKKEKIEDIISGKEIHERTSDICHEVKNMISIIEKHYKDPYSSEGLFEIFNDGLLQVPYLWLQRDKYQKAISYDTALINGVIKVVNQNGEPVCPSQRLLDILSEKEHKKWDTQKN